MRSPGLVDEGTGVQLRVGDDRLQGLDGLFEILNVPFVVIGAAEEESVARRQKIVGNVLVDARSIGIWPADEDRFTTPDEICEIVNRYLDRLTLVNAICACIDKELVDRVGLAPVHVFIQCGFSGDTICDAPVVEEHIKSHCRVSFI